MENGDRIVGGDGLRRRNPKQSREIKSRLARRRLEEVLLFAHEEGESNKLERP